MRDMESPGIESLTGKRAGDSQEEESTSATKRKSSSSNLQGLQGLYALKYFDGVRKGI